MNDKVRTLRRKRVASPFCAFLSRKKTLIHIAFDARRSECPPVHALGVKVQSVKQDFGTLVIGGLQRLGMATLLIVVYADLFYRLQARDALRQALKGLLFGLGATLAMNTPMTLSPGIVVDPRHVLLGLSGAFGGWPAAVIAALIASAHRINTGGIGASAGVIGIAVAASAGLAYRRSVVKRAGLSLGELLGLGALTSCSALSVLVLPSELRWSVLLELAPALALTTPCGIVVLGGMLTRVQRGLIAEAALRQAATFDALTGLLNRRTFREKFDAAVRDERNARYGLALLMIDLDGFKELNDQCGHQIGDAALAAVGAVIQESTAPPDFSARLGGDEFVAVLNASSLDVAKAKAEVIRSAVESLGTELPLYPARLTVSIGVAILLPTMNSHDLLRQADEALYSSKRRGRNRVTASGPKLSLVAAAG